MDNRINIVGDCYKKFGLTHTSKSQNTIPDDIRFRNYILISKKEKANLPTNCSFTGGTISHEIIQAMKCQDKTFAEAFAIIKNKIDQYEPVDTKDEIKFGHIIENEEELEKMLKHPT